MQLLLALYWEFFKIGLFGFGGGYAMIPLVQQSILNLGWISAQEFANVIAISEATPGPIAINTATYVGFKIGGVPGSLSATLGVITPPFILISVIVYLLHRYATSPKTEGFLLFLRPTVIGLIAAAAFALGRHNLVDIPSLVIASMALLALLKTSIHPILVIVLAGFAGGIIY